MSKKTNGIQVGNFIVTRDNGSEHDRSEEHTSELQSQR